MRRADRLFQIIQYLRGRRRLTAEKLASRLEVSKRTIYRDIADLMASGVPIEGEAGVGYVLQGGYNVPPLMFTEDEIVALVAGARLLRAFGGWSMVAASEEALVKIQSVLPEATQARADRVEIHAMNAAETDEETRRFLDQLEAAEYSQTKLKISYCDEKGVRSERMIRPLGLWFWGKVWTLIAWCELRDDFRMFRVDRIVALETGERFRSERDKTLRAFFQNECHLKRREGAP